MDAATTRYPCIFTTALLAGCAVCDLAEHGAQAESQTVSCLIPQAHSDCSLLHGLLRAKSVFALKQPDTSAAMPHALAMKLECGGLQGMQHALSIQGTIPDIQQLHSVARGRYPNLGELPFEQIVGNIVHWQGRRRAKRLPDPAEKH